MERQVLLCNDPALLESIPNLQFAEVFLQQVPEAYETRMFKCINPSPVQLSSCTGLKLPFGMFPNPYNPNVQFCDVIATQDVQNFVERVEQHVIKVGPGIPEKLRSGDGFSSILKRGLMRLKVTAQTRFYRMTETGEVSQIKSPQLSRGSVIVPVISMGLSFFNVRRHRSGIVWLLRDALVLSDTAPPPQFLNLEKLSSMGPIASAPPLEAKEAPSVKKDETECAICLDAAVTMVCIPCRHCCMCKACAMGLQGGKCPMCRANLVKVVSWQSVAQNMKIFVA
jgi:hypothetical protein